MLYLPAKISPCCFAAFHTDRETPTMCCTALYREKLFTQGWLQCPWKTRSKGKDESGLPIHTNLEHSFQPDFRRRRVAATVTQDKMLTGLVDALW